MILFNAKEYWTELKIHRWLGRWKKGFERKKTCKQTKKNGLHLSQNGSQHMYTVKLQLLIFCAKKYGPGWMDGWVDGW